MPSKVYLKPPPTTRIALLVQVVLGVLFLPHGIVFMVISEGESRPFVSMFALIWAAACIGVILHAVKALQLVNAGKLEIAELDASAGEAESGFAARLRDLEMLKKDGLISNSEYRRKRAEIMQEKW